jgi:hypothetical protein
MSRGRPMSAYERWTWERCRRPILSLKNRLGYDERLWILGFELLDDGRLRDPFHGVEVFNPATAGPATAIPRQYSGVPEMYCILSRYATAPEVRLTGQWLSLAAVNQVRPSGLSPQECATLLNYADHDIRRLRSVGVPFFDETLQMGTLALQVRPLPRVPVRIVLWRGDEGVDDGGTLLFDSSVATILPNLLTEVAALTVWRLQNILDRGAKWGYHQLAGGPRQ